MEVVFTPRAKKDLEKLRKNKSLYQKAVNLLNLIEDDPFASPPSFEKLVGLERVYSRRINIKHRLVYQVYFDLNTIKIIMMYNHYGE